MGWFSCMCRPSSRRRRSTTATSAPPPLPQQQEGSMDRSIEEIGSEEDLQAVKSWREKKRILPPLSSSSSFNTSTALVVFDGRNQRDLSTIDEGTNDSRNTSVSASPSLEAALPSKLVDDMITAIPRLSPTINDNTHDDGDNNNYKHHPQLMKFTDQPTFESLQPQYYNPAITNPQFQPIVENGPNAIYDDYKGERDNRHHHQQYRNESSTRYGGGGFPTLSLEEEEWRKEQPYRWGEF